MKTIFVSSTFKDMHFERDLIHEKVLPDLNDYAAAYGESVSFCDLRWGVNTGDLESEEGSRKVLSVCLDEIDRCRPYMIVILGERYGWIPEEQLIEGAVREKKDFALEELEKSVTALEIEYGALSRKEQLERTLFYFRDFEDQNMPDIYKTEDAYHAEKLGHLKERIRKLTGGRIKSYTAGWDQERKCITGLERFVELVTQDVKELLEREWKEYAKLTPFEKDQRSQWDYARQKAEQFGAREHMISAYREKLVHGQRLLVLKGAAGSGKSTLMSRLAVRLAGEGYDVLPLFCGHTLMSDDTLDLIGSIVYYIEDYFSLPHYEEKKAAEQNRRDSVRKWADRMAELTAYYESNSDKTLVIFIDAADQLFADEARDQLMFIPTNLSEKVRMVLSCLDTFALPSISETEQVEPLGESDKRGVVEGITRFLGRELEAAVIDRMIQRKASASPLYLSLLIQRLVMMNKSDFDDITAHGDGMSAITAHQIRLVEQSSDTLHGVCVDILETAAERIGGKMVRTAVMYMAVSRHGLREKDLEALLTAEGIEWNSLDFSLFMKYMRSFFIRRDDGRYDFAHKSIREGFLMECENSRRLHERLLLYFDSLDCQDKIRIQEIMYHCCQADDRHYLVRYVNEYEDQDEIIDPAAKDIYEYAMEDGGKMLCEILSEKETYDIGHMFLQFVNIDLDWAFGISQRELNVQEKIMTEAVCLAKRLAVESDAAQAKRDVTACYYTLGNIYEIYDSQADRDRVRGMYLEALKIREELDREEQTVESKTRLAYAFFSMGNIYETDGSQESLKEALSLYQKALELRRELGQSDPAPVRRKRIAASLDAMGDIYLTLGSAEDLGEALSLYQEALRIRQGMLEEADTRENQKRLMDSYRNIASVYEKLEGKENLEHALSLYQKVLTVRGRQAAEDRSVAGRSGLAKSYADLGNIYYTFRTENDCQKSLAMYGKALEIRRQLVRELGTADSLHSLAAACRRMAFVYRQYKDRERLQKALTLYQEALDIQTQLARERKTADSLAGISVTYAGMGVVYKEMNSQKDLKQALAMYQSAIETQEQVIEMQQTMSSRSFLVSYIIEAGGIYECLAGKENLMLAAGMFAKALSLQSEIAEALRTAESRSFLAYVYYRIAECYVQRGGSHNLALAKEPCMEAVKIWESLDESQQTTESKGRLALGCSMAGSVYQKLETPEHLKKALALYEKERELSGELVRIEVVGSKRNYASACIHLADVYAELGGEKNLRKAMELYRECCESREASVRESGAASEKEALADSYAGWVKLYLALNEEFDRAEVLQKRSLEIREELDRELATARSKAALASAYDGLGGLYLSYGDPAHLRQAGQMFEKAIRLGRELVEELGMAEGRGALSSSLMNLGDVYRMLGGVENAEHARKLYEEGLVIQEEAASELGTLTIKALLVGQLERIAYIYYDSGSREGFLRALELYVRGYDILLEIVGEDDSARCRGWIAGFCQNMGDIYCALQGQENFMLALEKYEKALEIYTGIEKELDTVKSREQLAYAYETTGNAYRNLGGRDNLDKALAYYEKNLSLSRRLDRETGTAANKKRVAVACEKIADIYLSYGGREYLEQALSLFVRETAIWGSLTDRMGRCEVLRGLAISHQKTADTYKALGGQEAHRQALDLYEKTIGLWQELCAESGRVADQRDIGICYERMGDIYRCQKDAEALQKSLEYYEAAVRVGEQLAEELDTLDARRILYINRLNLMEVCVNLGDLILSHKQDAQGARKLYEKACGISSILVEERPDAEHRDYHGSCLIRLLQIYSTGGREEDLQKILEISRECLEIYEKLMDERRSIQNWDNYIMVLYFLVINPLVEASEKLDYVERMRVSSGELYEKTGNPRHKNFIDAAEQMLKIIRGE